MTNKNYILCIFLSVIGFNMNAQPEFNIGAGLGIHQIGERYAPGIIVAPRLNIVDLSDAASVSVGTFASLLYFSTPDGTMQLPETRFGFEAPVVVSINFGRDANEYAIEQFGFVVGLGYNYGQLTLSGDGYEELLRSDGITIMGGIRVHAFNNRTVGLNVSQTFGRGTNRNSLRSLSVRALFYFGEQ